MIYADPIFQTKPDPWPVSQHADTPLNLAPAISAEKRTINVNRTYRGCRIFLEVPSHFTADRTSRLVNRFCQALDYGNYRTRPELG